MNNKDDILTLSGPDSDRYSRLKLIEWWNQSRIDEARVMVVGCGALGNEVLKNLALIGVGNIWAVDFDVIEISNLSRSVLYRMGDRGLPKAEVAAIRIREMNPDVRIRSLKRDITYEVGLGAYRRMNIVLGCLDSRDARLAVNQACWRAGVPWIDGALQELLGSVKVFVPPDGACYECTLAEADYQALSERYSCTLVQRDLLTPIIPTTPMSASIVGALQVQEAIKLLHQLDPLPARGGFGVFINGMQNKYDVVGYKRAEFCMSHEYYEGVIELPIHVDSITLRDLLRIAEERLGRGTLVDLRREIVTHLECPNCGLKTDLFKPLAALREQGTYCPNCGEVRYPSMTHVITGDEDFLEYHPSDIGVPPLDIVIARNGDNHLFLEFSSDVEQLLRSGKIFDSDYLEAQDANTRRTSQG